MSKATQAAQPCSHLLPVIGTLEEVGAELAKRNGYLSFAVQVHGFWSDDALTVYLKRRSKYRLNERMEVDEVSPEYEVQVSHSSGGRDTDEVSNDITAARNYARALLAASDLGEFLLTNATRIECGHEAEMKMRKEQEEAAKRAAEQAIRDDRGCNAEEAEAVMAFASENPGREVMLRRRGDLSAVAAMPLLQARKGRDGSMRFWFEGQQVAAKMVPAKLEQAISARSLDGGLELM